MKEGNEGNDQKEMFSDMKENWIFNCNILLSF